MSIPWRMPPSFASSSYSYSRSYQKTKIEIDSDDEPQMTKQTIRKPAKPKTPKPKVAKSQSQKKQLKTRDEYVEKIELFSCKICKNTYNSKGSLNRHFTTVHGLEKDVKEKKPKVAAAPKSKALSTWAPSRRFRCNLCGKELTSEAFLDRHMATHDKPAKPKVKQTKKVTTTNVNINVYNTNNYVTPSNCMTVARSIWD